MGNYNEEIKTVVDGLVLGMPGVVGGKAFGYPAYKVNGKIFAFVGQNGVALKLPAPRVKILIEEDPAIEYFQPAEGIVWREWILIDRETPEAYGLDIELLEESMLFVANA